MPWTDAGQDYLARLTGGQAMKIRTTYHGPFRQTSSGSWVRDGEMTDSWSAVDDDTYDGASTKGPSAAMGWGRTEAEAIADLKEQMEER